VTRPPRDGHDRGPVVRAAGADGAPAPTPPNGAGTPLAALQPLLVDLRGACQLLSVSAPTVKRLVPEMPPGCVIRLGRRRLFSRPALERWVAAGCPSHFRGGRRGRR
jgi:hypothetical protein